MNNRYALNHLLHTLVLCLAITPLSAQTYTALTWNIRYDNPNDSLDRWDGRKEALANEVMEQKPQIIGLQEALAHQLAYLDQRWPGYQRFGVGREDGKEKGEFSPVYFDTSAFELLEGRTVWLSETPDTPSKGWDAACERIATLVTLRDRSTNRTLWVLNTHWDHVGTLARMYSAFKMKELLADALSSGNRVILMGDLNATPDEGPVQFLKGSFMDSCPADHVDQATFNGFKPDQTGLRRIDYVWLSPTTWEVVSYDVPHPLISDRHLSDHFPVVVKVRAK